MKSIAHQGSRSLHTGYILLEMIIALAIFAIAVLGLAKALNNTLQVANTLNRDAAVLLSMRSFMEEERRKPLSEMATTYQDERLGVTLTSEVTPDEEKDPEGNVIADIYKLTVKSSYLSQGKQSEDSLSLLIYQTSEEQQKRKKKSK